MYTHLRNIRKETEKSIVSSLLHGMERKLHLIHCDLLEFLSAKGEPTYLIRSII